MGGNFSKHCRYDSEILHESRMICRENHMIALRFECDTPSPPHINELHEFCMDYTEGYIVFSGHNFIHTPPFFIGLVVWKFKDLEFQNGSCPFPETYRVDIYVIEVTSIEEIQDLSVHASLHGESVCFNPSSKQKVVFRIV
jgi:hypothetical protein